MMQVQIKYFAALREALGPGQTLVYAVRTQGAKVAAVLEGSRIEVHVPVEVAARWAHGADVSLEATQDAGDEQTLRILVEKDFACLTERPHEDDSDAFENPNGSC